MRNFKELKIWQKGFQIAINSFKIIKAFPKEEIFALCSQNTRGGFHSFKYCRGKQQEK